MENVDQVEHYDHREHLTKKQLDEMVEDDLDLEDDEFIKEYQAMRIEEMKQQAGKPRFGSVYSISKQDWEEHITNAPKGVNVVILFYQN